MDINVNSNVSYAVAKVIINSIIITKPTTAMVVVTPYNWVDKDGKVLRTGTQVYTEDVLQKAIGSVAFPALKAAMSSLFKHGTSQNLVINLNNFTASAGAIDSTTKKWVTSPVTNAEFVKALTDSGLSLAIFEGIIQGMGEQIFAH